jgi:uncharacterized membrane protein
MPTTVVNLATRPITGRRNGHAGQVNVGETERLLSALGGACMALYGISGRGAFNNLVLPIVGGMLVYRGLSGHCSLYSSLGVNTAEQPAPRTSVEAGEGVKVERSLTINKPAAELYRFWRKFDQLPRFMHHLEDVRELGGNRSHWIARAPLGMRVEWDAEIINERENELIAWRSLPGSDVDTAGSVHFSPAPGQRGCASP